MSEESELVQALAFCDEERALRLVRQKLAAGVPPAEIVAECNRGMIELGNRFAREECFIPDLMFGGEIMKVIMAELGPHLSASVSSTAGSNRPKVVIGTVQHDVHDIGKDIVVMLLQGAGFEVIDLGVDVPPEKFVEAIRAHQPTVMGMSILLTTCYDSVSRTMNAIREAGLRDKIAVMVGGAAASDLLAKATGCDFYGKTAVDGLMYACRIAGLQASV
jgi:5-methyltetrahydrofolate--homocysteine methyltransferase